MVQPCRKGVLDAVLTVFGDAKRVAAAAKSTGTLAAPGPMVRAPRPVDPEVTTKVIVRAGQCKAVGDWLGQNGCTVRSAHGEVLLTDVPASKLPELENCPGLVAVEAARPQQASLDEARGDATGLDAALAAASASDLDGRGVVVGVVDSGVDWMHPDFRNADDSTRLEMFMHARRDDGEEVSQFDLFDAAALDAALGDANPTDSVPQGDPNGHGTHVASIAAGNGRASAGTFRGVAPGAALMAVRSEPLLDTHTIRGIREIFARAGDRPAVVNLSLGGHWGPHDGTSAIENVIARESGPGRIVVVAAGNEGGDDIHSQVTLVEGGTVVLPLRVADAAFQFVDAWIPRGDEVDVEIETPLGDRIPVDGEVHQTLSGAFIADLAENPVNRDQNLNLRMAGTQVNDVWRIRFTATRVLHGIVHAWGGTRSAQTSRQVFPGAGPGFSVGMPATEERAITVGSYVSRNSFDVVGGSLIARGLSVGQLSPFSAFGPTRYGALKPDIAAPGQFITAALASDSELSAQQTRRHHPTDGYITIQGTSMATPFVAGLIALLLQREPDLTPEEIQQRLRVTARRDDDTGRVWSPGFGFGKVDVQALLDF